MNRSTNNIWLRFSIVASGVLVDWCGIEFFSY